MGFCLTACLFLPRCAESAEPGSPAELERVSKNKETILTRLRPEKATYRGSKPGEVRLRWEWYNRAVGNYIYEKSALMTVEAFETDSQHDLRPGWMYKDMKVTFQEILRLGSEDDDKLVPVLSHRGFLDLVPNARLAGSHCAARRAR